MAFQDGFGDIYMAGASGRLQEDTYNVSHLALASLQQHTVYAMLDGTVACFAACATVSNPANASRWFAAACIVSALHSSAKGKLADCAAVRMLWCSKSQGMALTQTLHCNAVSVLCDSSPP